MLKIDIAIQPCTFVQCQERYPVFAPSWDLLARWKSGDMKWDDYRDVYMSEMRIAYRKDAQPFLLMAERLDQVEFVCWCVKKNLKDTHCHRFLLREILTTIRNKRDRKK